MIILKKAFSIGLIFAVLICSTAIIKIVSAQSIEPTDTQIQLVRDNCLPLKATLNQLHASDALLRVNMGQLYESISIKLMRGFNKRIENNNLDNGSLVSTTKNYNSTLDKFRIDYQSFEEQLSSAISIDCQNQPKSFYNSIALAQTYRNRVHTDVLKLNQYIIHYQSDLNQFEQDYSFSLEGTVR